MGKKTVLGLAALALVGFVTGCCHDGNCLCQNGSCPSNYGGKPTWSWPWSAAKQQQLQQQQLQQQQQQQQQLAQQQMMQQQMMQQPGGPNGGVQPIGFRQQQPMGGTPVGTPSGPAQPQLGVPTSMKQEPVNGGATTGTIVRESAILSRGSDEVLVTNGPPAVLPPSPPPSAAALAGGQNSLENGLDVPPPPLPSKGGMTTSAPSVSPPAMPAGARPTTRVTTPDVQVLQPGEGEN